MAVRRLHVFANLTLTCALELTIYVYVLHHVTFTGVPAIIVFSVFSFGLFLLTFWNSEPDSAILIILASFFMVFFILNPYILTVVDWRNYVIEEADALLHSSKTMNKALKLGMTILLTVVISSIQYGLIQVVMVGGSLSSIGIYFGIIFDFSSLLLPTVLFGLYTLLPFEMVVLLGSTPGLLMM